MRFANVTKVRNCLSSYLALVRKRQEPLVITSNGMPDPLIQPITEQDLDHLEWKGIAARRLNQAWDKEQDALYDYL